MHLSAENNCPRLVCDSLRAIVGNGAMVDAVTRQEMLRVALDKSGVHLERCDLPSQRSKDATF
jgi:hypothetical protein